MKRFVLCILVCIATCLPQTGMAAGETDAAQWWGEYCNEQRCLQISNVGEGPMGWYFGFAFFTGETLLGEGMAALEGDTAGYAAASFTMEKNAAAVKVALDAKGTLDADDAWLKDCAGTYTRRP